jgi:hypothetical protein
MTLNEMTEKSVAELLGNLALENAKLKALVDHFKAENTALKARVAKSGSETPEGDSASA